MAIDMEALRTKASPEHTALVIIDMQKDYCCESGVFDRRGFDIAAAQRLAPRLKEFANKTAEFGERNISIVLNCLEELKQRVPTK